MKLDHIHNVYFLGIGGIGMSALARYFKNIGKQVAGYDKTATELTVALESEGIQVHYEDNVALIPVSFFEKETTLVVLTPAIPKDQSEWNYFVNNNFIIKKRAEVLGIITAGTYTFAVAGTHGKTTTSSILGHLLYDAGKDVTAFVGGITLNYGTNLIGEGKTITVVEADEFDRSFMHLSPNKACITSMDADHLDIYGDEETIQQTFKDFAGKIEDKQHFYAVDQVALQGKKIGWESDADFSIQNVAIQSGVYQFDIKTPKEIIPSVTFRLPGKHNLMNALTAFAMAYDYGVSADQLKKSLGTFKGIERRFSTHIATDKQVYIDDYAHHPTEINAVYQAVKELYPTRKTKAIFQPHLFSRTRDFMDGFATSLSQFDEVILLDIYPARELPMEGITSQVLLDKMTLKSKQLLSKEALIENLKSTSSPVVVTIGAGDIGAMVGTIKEILS